MKRVRIILSAIVLANGLVSEAQNKSLTLDEIFKLADENNPQIAASAQSVNEAYESQSVARNAKLPDIDVSASISYIGNAWVADRDFSNGADYNTPHFGNGVDITISQLLYAGGGVKRNIEIAELSHEIATLAHSNTRQMVRLNLANSYLELCKLLNHKQIIEQNIERTKLLLNDIKANYEAGTALKSDITRHDLMLKNLEMKLVSTNSTIEILNRQLTQNIGLEDGTTIIPDTTFLQHVSNNNGNTDWATSTNDKFDVQLMEAAMHAPQVVASEKSAEVAKVAEEAAHAPMRPTIALRLEDKLEGPITYEIPTLDKNVNYWYAGIGVSYNVGNVYKQRRVIKQKQVAKNVAEERHRNVVNNYKCAVHAANVRLQEAKENKGTKEQSLVLAKENYENVHYRYVNGMALITDILDASNQQLEAELSLANSRIEIAEAHVLLMALIGQL